MAYLGNYSKTAVYDPLLLKTKLVFAGTDKLILTKQGAVISVTDPVGRNKEDLENIAEQASENLRKFGLNSNAVKGTRKPARITIVTIGHSPF